MYVLTVQDNSVVLRYNTYLVFKLTPARVLLGGEIRRACAHQQLLEGTVGQSRSQ
jgi:hypothetical protein